MRILVSGMLAGVPGQGGATWSVLQYLLGLRRLGHDVWFVEEATGRPGSVAYFRGVTAEAGLTERSAMLVPGGNETVGVPYRRLADVVRTTDVLLNISGSLTDERMLESIARRVYLDVDPAFTQLWQAREGIDMRLDAHTHLASFGQRIGSTDCPVPTAGRTWIPTIPPVVLEHWPRAEREPQHGMTTVTNWRGYGSVEVDGVHYGQKAHSFRTLLALPERTSERFEVALAIHPDEHDDLAALRVHGWHLLDPAAVAGTPADFRHFVRASRAEIGVAKSGYVVSRCGWFSDRSACYLASGRPVVFQDTGIAGLLPTGRGLLTFSTEDEAASAVLEIREDYEGHAEAARELAEEHLDSDVVLRALLEAVQVPG